MVRQVLLAGISAAALRWAVRIWEWERAMNVRTVTIENGWASDGVNKWRWTGVVPICPPAPWEPLEVTVRAEWPLGTSSTTPAQRTPWRLE